ncbi:hypothetical protein DPMN_162297 [Dreissena polymorpha]|uniref:Uncharacterized protein n=1 Tax=Dreissena polymorpha TaxID=45954 RepID=A0A9D4ERD2_DREPO|nr:hypothetical protein DPMN_162297 [Dreissena polymorpha]
MSGVEVTVQQKCNSSQTLDTILAPSSTKIELKPNTGPVLTSLLLTAEIPFKPDTGPELTSLLCQLCQPNQLRFKCYFALLPNLITRLTTVKTNFDLKLLTDILKGN